MMEHGLNPIDEGSLEYLRAVSSDLCSGKEGKEGLEQGDQLGSYCHYSQER